MDFSDRRYRRQARLLGGSILILAVLGVLLAVVALVIQPMDNDALNILGVVFFGPLLVWGTRQFKQAKAKLNYARINAR